MAYKLNVGDTIPTFTALDSEGHQITHEEILGGPFVLYFYPKDDTPGCTKEACSFRDLMDSFEEMDILVVGVSPDSPESHQKFSQKHGLNFPLLSDPKMEMCKEFEVVKDGGSSVERTTFLCDEDGVIQWLERPVRVDGHVERVMAAIEEALS
jgi:peroxiredoxin Q/BCP